MSARTTGTFTFRDWQEKTLTTWGAPPAGPGGEGPRLAHAGVTNSFTGGIEAPATTCEYTITYVTARAGTFTGMQVLTGRLDGREGTFVAEERGGFGEDGIVRCTFEVVPGSGTGALRGLRGTGTYVARPGAPSVEYAFTYELG
ncbi:DUF3224 domain-containing protein [Streptomyces sp. NPDC059740]|uniref:DUF3224 domain-containing protein n=1 Tax=Streptomyces sp. NPDC059740 TaxID=3346926 RepID=UPI003648392C